MNFAEATEAPIIERIGGQDVTFPVLWIEDYLPWIAQIAAERKAKMLKLIPPKADAQEQFRLKRAIELDEPNVDVIAERVWTLAGAAKILDLSLAKGGFTNEADRKQVLQRIPMRRLCPLASEVSGLYERTPKSKPGDGQNNNAEGTDPNARSAEATPSSAAEGDPAATGSPT